MGVNTLDFEVNDVFLEAFAPESSYKADVKVVITVLKSDNLYDVKANLEGTVLLTCDLCLDEFSFPVQREVGFLIKLSEEERYDDDEIVYITPTTIDFDLSQFLFDSFMLSLPTKSTCGLGGKACNEDVTKKLSKLNSHDDEEKGDDPRWDKLKGMINPN